MTSSQQRAALQRQIWAIANDVRGAVDGWDFKQYVLGTLFYRFISENFAAYIEGGDDSVNYAELPDSVITPDIKDDAIKTKGYFIYPSQLFANVAKDANNNESLNTDLAAIFAAIEASASGYPSEQDIKGLFADFDTTSNRLGNTVIDKNKRLADVLKGVAGLEFGDFEGSHIDLFGDAYEFLISNYAANAGKSGGEFFTPQHVSKLIAQLAMHKQASVNKIYDPAAGSGSLLLQAKKHFDAHVIEEGFFGQEINHTTYNLARMNMFLHNINYDKFNMQLGNTLTGPHFLDDKPFDAIVSNPPYSVKWIGSDDPTLINDDRFAPAGVLAPKSKADFAFVLHALSYLSSKGRAAIVCFPGIFYRGGTEQKIRKYLVDNNYVETVISLAPNLFFGTTIAVNILVLSKHKTDTTTQFIDANGEAYFKKETNTNVLTDKHIEDIMKVFDSKKNVEHFALSVPYEQIAANDYNLSVSSYVEAKDTREVVDIKQLNAELETTVARITQLRNDIDAIVAEIEGEEPRDQLLSFDEGEVEWKTLGELSENLDSKRKPIKSGLREAGDIPYYGASGVVDYVKDYIFDGNFLLVSEDGANLLARNTPIAFSISGKTWVNNHAHVLKFDTYAERKYVEYYLNSIDLTPYISGAAQPKLNKKNLESIRIPNPSLIEKEGIVEILDKFDALTNSISEGLPREIELRQKQYEYYRDLLLSSPKPDAEVVA
ncbi:type I restriction-modification system subunit M [Neptuniibacter pectenicola]|uniref:type I restriction-modification system subunit M n=1 Tax=Neptuniibacter pectenicola TaxID=1806669 RepID=UPI0009472C1D|nr:type I restriction-modification system subunit M [Neptuniibacter pectenicola]